MENALSKEARNICQLGPVVPVIVLEDADDATPLGEALLAGGIKVLEITMRTPAALAAIEEAAKIDGAIVGAGTVLSKADLLNAKSAGAQFVVSPGFNEDIIEAAKEADMPLLPGAITPAEVMTLRSAGFHMLKFFPANTAGGPKMLQAFGSVFTDVSFCPTGGISAATASDYLSLSNVSCVGGSWLAPKDQIADKDFAAITNLATAAAAL